MGSQVAINGVIGRVMARGHQVVRAKVGLGPNTRNRSTRHVNQTNPNRKMGSIASSVCVRFTKAVRIEEGQSTRLYRPSRLRKRVTKPLTSCYEANHGNLPASGGVQEWQRS